MKYLTVQHPIYNIRTVLIEHLEGNRGEQKKEQKYCMIIFEPIHCFLYKFFQILVYQNNLLFHSFRAPNLHEQGCKVTLSQTVRASAGLCCTQTVTGSTANVIFEIRIAMSNFSPQASCRSLRRLLFIVLASFRFPQSSTNSQKFFALAFDYPPVLHFCSALLDSLPNQDCTDTNTHMDGDDKSNIPNDT